MGVKDAGGRMRKGEGMVVVRVEERMFRLRGASGAFNKL